MLSIFVEGFDKTATGSPHDLHEDDISLGSGLDRPICLCEGGGGMGLALESANDSTLSHLNL